MNTVLLGEAEVGIVEVAVSGKIAEYPKILDTQAGYHSGNPNVHRYAHAEADAKKQTTPENTPLL